MKREFKNCLLALFALGLGILLYTGCSKSSQDGRGDSSGTGPNAGKTKIRLPNTITELAMVADGKGYFAEQNIVIEWTGTQAHGPAAIVSMVAGQNDACASINTAMIDAINNGAEMTIVCASGPNAKHEPTITWLVLEGNTDVNSPRDFAGKKITGNSSTISWYPVVEYFRKNNLDIDKVEFVSLPAPQQEQALRQSEVAAVASSTIFTHQILANGGVKALFNDYDVLGIEHIGGWAFNNSFIDAHPDAVRGFIAALSKAVSWIKESEANTKEAIDIVYAKGGNSIWLRWGEGDEKLLLTDHDIQAWIDILTIYGNIKEGQFVPFDIYTNKFNPYYQP
jgi:ABC-type nitrate/sulfonate/bicarbonate transport system substrate-binding protein